MICVINIAQTAPLVKRRASLLRPIAVALPQEAGALGPAGGLQALQIIGQEAPGMGLSLIHI